MKKLSNVLFIFMTLILTIGISVSAATTTKTITLKKKTATVKVTVTVGDKVKLVVKEGKKTVTNKAKYKTSKSSVAKVSKKGVITTKKAGSAVITVKKGKKTVKVKLQVKAKSKSKETTKTKTHQMDTEFEKKKNEHLKKENADKTPLTSYEELEKKWPREYCPGQIRVHLELCESNFDNNTEIKFNKVYYIKGQDDRFFGKIRYTFITKDSKPTYPEIKTICANLYGSTEETSESFSIRETYNKKLYNNNEPSAYLKEKLDGRTPCWSSFYMTENAFYVYGSADEGKTFFFFALPSMKKGQCTETFNVISFQVPGGWYQTDFDVLYKLKLNDVNN